MRIIKLALAGLFASFMFSTPAQAVLLLDIEGTAGSGFTTWTFSGSVDIKRRRFGRFTRDDDFRSFSGWRDFAGGSFTSLDDAVFTRDSGAITGSATVFSRGETRAIDAILVDGASDRNTRQLDIGVESPVDPTADSLKFLELDVVIWDGVLTVRGIDLNDLGAPSSRTVFTSSTFNGPPGTLDLRLTIAPTAVIPLPATLPLLLGALGVFVLAARRKRTLGALPTAPIGQVSQQ